MQPEIFIYFMSSPESAKGSQVSYYNLKKLLLGILGHALKTYEIGYLVPKLDKKKMKY